MRLLAFKIIKNSTDDFIFFTKIAVLKEAEVDFLDWGIGLVNFCCSVEF